MDTASSGSFGLPSLLTALRHQWVPIVVVFLLTLSLGWAYTEIVKPTYTAEATTLVSPVPGNPLTAEAASASGAQLSVAMETEAGLVTTPAIAEIASTSAGRVLPGSGESLRVDVPAGTQTVQVRFSSGSPERAQEGAQSFADAYLQYRGDRAEESQTARLDSLQAQAENADENLRRAVSEASESDSATFASQEVQLYADRLAQVNESISATEVVSTDPGRVLNPARTPESADGVRPLWILIGSGILGLVLGGLVAILREWRADLIRENEAADVHGVPIFAKITPVAGGSAFFGAGNDANREEYRRLRAGVVANGPRPHVVGVAAVDAAEHASVVTANLAAALAEAGFSVLAVAADPFDSGVESSFGVPVAPGLSDVITGDRPTHEAFRAAEGVTVLATGSDPESARETYAGPAFRQMVDQVRQEFDYVVLAAAGAGSADGDAVIGAADSVLLVLSSSRTTHARVAAALDRFRRLGISTLGAVLAPDVALGRHRRESTGDAEPTRKEGQRSESEKTSSPDRAIDDVDARA
ncbi:hypothetical protein BH23ACT6_BH23ACT6_05730 [soil metagenome]